MSVLMPCVGPSSSGNGSPIGRSNSTTKVYFVGKEVSPIVQTNGVNGHARHSPAPSEPRKFDKVMILNILFIVVNC